MPGTPEFQRRLELVESLIRQIEAAGDPNIRMAAREMVQLVMELHGAGLERILEILRANGQAGQSVLDTLGRDDLVSSLLVLYGLHPLGMEERVRQAIDKANRQMRSAGAAVEMIGMEDGAVHLRLKKNGQAPALREAIEAAIYEAAPDIASLAIDGADDNQGFVPVEMLLGIPAVQPVTNGHAREKPGNVRP
jgi:hypothetical protein